MTSSVGITSEEYASQPYLPAYNRAYHHSACKAYNMVRHVIDVLRLDDTVFATAMCYWHAFVAKHGLRRMNEVVLAAACIFLAGKVEHYKLRADQVSRIVFDLDERAPTEEVEGWRRMLLEVELVLSDSLGFDFQRAHPIEQILQLVASPSSSISDNKAAGAHKESEEERKKLIAELQRAAHCLYLLSLLTPLCIKASPDDIAATITYMTVHYSGNEKRYSHIWKDHPLPDAVERDGIAGAVMDVFAYTRKDTHLGRLDELIKARRKRLRRESSSEGNPTVMYSSSVASFDASPVMRTYE